MRRLLGLLTILILLPACGRQANPPASSLPVVTAPETAAAKHAPTEPDAEAKRQAELAKLPPYERLLKGEDLKRAGEMEKKIAELESADNDAEAIHAANELRALRTSVQGTEHHEALNVKWDVDALKKVGAMPADQRAAWRIAVRGAIEAQELESKGRHDLALPLQQKLLDLRQKVLGEEHRHTAGSYDDVSFNLYAQGKHDAAEPLFLKVLAIRRRTLGEEHPDTASSYNNLAANLDAQGQHPAAEPLYMKALAIRKKVLGEEHADTAGSYNNVAANLDTQAKYAAAEQLHLKALAIWQKVLGEEHADTASSYNNVAANLFAQGKNAAAEPLFLKALAICRKVLGEEHPDTADSYNSVAINLNAQGMYAAAEPLYWKALAIRQKVSGEEHPQTAISYNNVAFVLHAQEKYAAAEPLFLKALAICQKVLGEEHPDTASTYNGVAGNLDSQGKCAAAEPIYLRALAIRQKVLGEEHPDTATTYNNVAVNLSAQGNHAAAEPFFLRALAIRQKALGEEHPDTAACYQSVAANLYAQGKYAAAEPMARASVAALEAARLRGVVSGLGRAIAQRFSPRQTWAAALLHTGHPAQTWEVLEGHFGRGLLDDLSARQTRILTADEHKELDDLNAKLRMYEKQIGNMLSSKEGLEANREKFEALVKERQVAETGLAQLAARLQQKEIYDWKVVQKSLPPDAALITWLDLEGHSKAARPQGEHWAFLLKATGEPVVVELKGANLTPGPSPERRGESSWTEDDTALSTELRPFLTKPPRRGADVIAMCRQLGQQRLGPLEPHLTGVKHLIVLPSEAVAGIPLEALTDRFTVSYAPSGTVFAKLMAQSRDRQGAGGGERARQRNLLAVGDPAYVKAEDRLPGTRREVTAIGELFPQKKLLLGAEASVQQLEELVKNDQLKAFNVLHLATHGEQNPHVALYTKLRLAGDGQITAGDIYQDWKGKLDADLVVLSACETGLGRRAGGEGYLGFTQPLFLAGARSVILSQWPVSDEATALLMVRFYEIWLGKRSAPLSKAAALREAKQWLKNLSREQAEAALGDLNTRTRGLQLAPAETPNAHERPFAHPFYWSSFILIGDPR